MGIFLRVDLEHLSNVITDACQRSDRGEPTDSVEFLTLSVVFTQQLVSYHFQWFHLQFGLLYLSIWLFNPVRVGG